MNIFYLHEEPEIAAELHCDKHVVKMIIEYAQLLSTAHRMLDGKHYIDDSSGRRIQDGDLKVKWKTYTRLHTSTTHPIYGFERTQFTTNLYMTYLQLCVRSTPIVMPGPI